MDHDDLDYDEESLLGNNAGIKTEPKLSNNISSKAKTQRLIGVTLNSPSFWVLVVLLVALDLAIFMWQVVYSTDARLESLEAFITALFMLEIVLRIYAHELNFKSFLQVLDAVVVFTAFVTSLLAVNNPILLGRVARVVMVLRGGTRVSRASRALQPVNLPANKPIPKPETVGVFYRAPPSLANLVNQIIEKKNTPVAHRDLLQQCSANSYRISQSEGMGAEGATSKSKELLLTVAALDVIRQYCKEEHQGSHNRKWTQFHEMLRGTTMVFPEKSL